MWSVCKAHCVLITWCCTPATNSNDVVITTDFIGQCLCSYGWTCDVVAPHMTDRSSRMCWQRVLSGTNRAIELLFNIASCKSMPHPLLKAVDQRTLSCSTVNVPVVSPATCTTNGTRWIDIAVAGHCDVTGRHCCKFWRRRCCKSWRRRRCSPESCSWCRCSCCTCRGSLLQASSTVADVVAHIAGAVRRYNSHRRRLLQVMPPSAACCGKHRGYC